MGAKDGGAEMTFWVPVYTMSTPHSSMKKGTAPREATTSTASSAPYLEKIHENDTLVFVIQKVKGLQYKQNILPYTIVYGSWN